MPLPSHIERRRWEQEPRTYRSRSAYETEPTNPGLWSGPYRVTGVTPGAGINLERNDAWRGPAPAFRRIAVRTVENTTALEAQLLAGQLDMIAGELGLPLDQAAALERRTGNRFRFLYKPGLIYEHLDVNHDTPLLADRRVRHALISAVDRGQIIQRLFEDRQVLAHTGVNPLDWVHDNNVQQWPFDLARARTLLEEAGWRPGPDGIRRNAAGERLTIELMTTAGNRSREAVQQVIQGMWRQAGIEARIRNEPPRVLFGETLNRRRFTRRGAVRVDQRAGERAAHDAALGRDSDRGAQLLRPELHRLPQHRDGRAAGSHPDRAGPRGARAAVAPVAGDLRGGTAGDPAVVPLRRACLAGLAGWRGADGAPDAVLAVGGAVAREVRGALDA